MWITEWNMDPWGADPNNPANLGGPPLPQLTDGDVKHMQAKAVLRFLTASVNKGVSAVYFYAAKHGNLALVDPAFFTALETGGGAYPGDNAGGETMLAVRRLSASLTGTQVIDQPRSLSLQEVGDYEGGKQFEGDGTDAHPALYDRDVVGFFPYQVNERRFVIPVYVMTRNIAKLYRPEAPVGDTSRFDLPEGRFRLTIGGLRDSGQIGVRASDPLSGRSVPTRVVSRSSDTLVVELPLTDSPRLLVIDELTAAGTTVAPLEVADLRVEPARWRLGSRLPRLSRQIRVGTKISYRLSAAAKVGLTFERVKAGRKVGRRCARPSRRMKRRKRCIRLVRAGHLSVNARAGLNQMRFEGRLSRRRRLKPGRYLLTASATDRNGNRARPKSTRFTVLRGRRR
jgi:hypothetical protein